MSFFLLEHFWLCFCLSPHGVLRRQRIWVGQEAGTLHYQESTWEVLSGRVGELPPAMGPEDW